MVSHPTPFIANLFLYYFDNNWSWNLHKTWKIANIFCFIDDVSAIINNGLFEKHFKEIYHDELELKKEKISITKISFLDIDLVIKEKKSWLNFWYKGLFPILIVLMPFFNSNIPSKSITSEILCLARKTSDCFTFLVNKPLDRMSKQGAKEE